MFTQLKHRFLLDDLSQVYPQPLSSTDSFQITSLIMPFLRLCILITKFDVYTGHSDVIHVVIDKQLSISLSFFEVWPFRVFFHKFQMETFSSSEKCTIPNSNGWFGTNCSPAMLLIVNSSNHFCCANDN